MPHLIVSMAQDILDAFAFKNVLDFKAIAHQLAISQGKSFFNAYIPCYL